MIINKEKTLSAFAEDEEIFFSVVDEFISTFDNQKQELISSLENKNIDDIRIRTHTIKGLAGTFYFESLKNVASVAEKAAKEGNLEVIEEVKDDLLLKFEELLTDAKRISNERK